MKKRIISILLSSTLILSMLASNIAYAAPDNKTNTVSGYIETEAQTEYIYETEYPEASSDKISEVFQETEVSVPETTVREETTENETESALIEETEENINNSSASIHSTSESENTAQVGDIFSNKFGKYKVLTVGDTPTAAIIDDPYTDLFGNFSYGDSSKPWTAEYKNVEYAVTEIRCEILGSGTAKIPEGITYIANGSFSQCAIKNIELPASLEHFDEDATLFFLENITVSDTNPYYKSDNGILMTKDEATLLLYPAKLPGETYTTPESVKNIAQGAFFNNFFLTNLNFTAVENIKDYAFFDMQKIEVIYLPKTLINLGTMYTTYNCYTLKAIYVEEGNPMLYDENGVLFYKSGSKFMLVIYPAAYPISEYYIPYGVKSISSFAFNGISKTQFIHIPSTVSTIYTFAFEETQIPIEFVLHFTSAKQLSQSAFNRLARGSKLYVVNNEIKDGFRKDFLTTRIDETGGTQIDTETPVIVDYEKAVSRFENWYVHDGKKYYYDIQGNLVNGLQEIDGDTYLFGKNHEMQTDFQDANGKTFYFVPEDGKMLRNCGISFIDDKKYYFNSDYSIYREAELNFDNRIYYLNTNTGEIICDSVSHNYGVWEEVTPPSCTSNGSQRHTCTKCNYAETVTIAKIPHQFGAWTIISAASCTKEGEQIHKCSLCGTTEKATISKLSHRPGMWVVSKQSTCISNGVKVLKCTICNQVLQTMPVPKTTHKYGTWKIQRQSTYSSTGIKVRSCSVCGSTERSVIPKLVKRDIGRSTVSTVKQRTYHGKTQSPSINIKYNGVSLKKNVDYSISYRNNKNPGKATIHITGKGAFYGTKKVYFYIAPKSPGIRRVYSKKKALSIQIKKASGSTGSQLFYSMSKSFKNRKYVSFSDSSKTIGKLKSKKTYYVKIRSYKKVGSKKIYGPYSNIKKIKIK